MKKITLLVVCAVVVAFMAGCEKKSTGPTPEQISEAAQVRLPAGQVMSSGPHGEAASSAADLVLSEDEIKKIVEGKYKVSIVFHYAGNDWSAAQQAGLKDQFRRMGIEILSITDANFKAEQQISDIENAMAMKPNAIVSIPVDPVSTSNAFKKAAAAGIKLVFMDNCPDNMAAGKEYVSVVSADNYGNGVAAAEIMAGAIGGQGKIAMMFHDANFFVTNQRDNAFRATIREKYPNIQIVEEMGFDDPNKGSEIGDALLTKHSDLKGIFATWDIPAEGIVSSLRAANRTDIAVTTIDLGDNVAKIIAENGVVKGLGAQRPYDQGVAEAILVGYALLGKNAPAYVALPALRVTHDNVLTAYEEVYHKAPPPAIKNSYKN